MLPTKRFLKFCFLLPLFHLLSSIQCHTSEPADMLEQQLASDPLAKEFMKNTPHLSIDTMQKIEADLMKRSQENEALAQDSRNCIIDWVAPCPIGWKKKEKAEDEEYICLSPSSYKGFCKTSISFALYTPEAKENWARSCQVKWPCRDDMKNSCSSGKRDFTLACPEGFNLQDEETCAPDLSQYQGPCQGLVNFTSFSDEAKKSWSITCGTVWPCYEECVNDYESDCPKGWTQESDGYCIAPKYYSGKCGIKRNFKYYTAAMKANFEKLCNVRFPCENNCEKDYSIPCPKGWKQQNEFCKPPATYSTCSVTKRSFQDLSSNEKASFENDCNVQWPCKKKDLCDRDWSLPCPEGWEYIAPPGLRLDKMALDPKIRIRCSPPVQFSGKNRNVQEFETQEQKRKWASEFGQPWPCKENVKSKKFEDTFFYPSSTIIASKFPNITKRPRSPYVVTDAREVGKHGPVQLETGKVMSHLQKKNYVTKNIHPFPQKPKMQTQIKYIEGALKAERGNLGLQSNVPFMHQVPIPEKAYNVGPKGFFNSGHFLPGYIY